MWDQGDRAVSCLFVDVRGMRGETSLGRATRRVRGCEECGRVLTRDCALTQDCSCVSS